MASVVYNNGKKVVNQNDWTAGTWRVLLATAAYVPDIDAHKFVSDITNELVGASYGRQLVANRTISVVNASDRADYLADVTTFTALNAGTPGWAIVYKFVTNDADSLLVCADQLPGTASNGGNYVIQWDSQASNGRVFSIL